MIHRERESECVCVRESMCVTPCVGASGYWNNERKTREAIRDGWMHTGDQVWPCVRPPPPPPTASHANRERERDVVIMLIHGKTR
jgi:hypothetical protein